MTAELGNRTRESPTSRPEIIIFYSPSQEPGISSTYGGVTRPEQRFGRRQEQFEVQIDVFFFFLGAVVRSGRTWQHGPGVANQELEEVDLTPFVNVNEHAAEAPIVRMQEVQSRRADRFESGRDAAYGQRGTVAQ